jgi:hypothetical protein
MPAKHLVALSICWVVGARVLSSLAQEMPGPASSPAPQMQAPAGTVPEPPPPVTPPPTSLPEAPFGLVWLTSKQAVADTGIELKNQMATEFGESYVVSRLPKELADQYYTVLSFGYDDRLIRITAIGRSLADDHTGSQVQARYAELQDLLRKKYGPGKAESHVDTGYDGIRWASGLQTKRNWMHTIFSGSDLKIELSVFSPGAPQTQWRIIFEYVPEIERLERRRREKEEKAL